MWGFSTGYLSGRASRAFATICDPGDTPYATLCNIKQRGASAGKQATRNPPGSSVVMTGGSLVDRVLQPSLALDVSEQALAELFENLPVIPHETIKDFNLLPYKVLVIFFFYGAARDRIDSFGHDEAAERFGRGLGQNDGFFYDNAPFGSDFGYQGLRSQVKSGGYVVSHQGNQNSGHVLHLLFRD
jgi:hypothetical protein